MGRQPRGSAHRSVGLISVDATGAMLLELYIIEKAQMLSQAIIAFFYYCIKAVLFSTRMGKSQCFYENWSVYLKVAGVRLMAKVRKKAERRRSSDAADSDATASETD